jgi:hypothetical protein
MAIHGGDDYTFVVNGGKVMTTGHSLNLPKGVFGIFDTSQVTSKGMAAVSKFNGDRNKKYVMKLGNHGYRNKSKSSIHFSLKDVVDFRADVPQSTKKTFDVFRIGYDGFSEDTAFKFKPGDAFDIEIELSGDAVGVYGYEKTIPTVLSIRVPDCSKLEPCDNCDPCSELNALDIVKKAVSEYMQTPLAYGRSITDLIDVKIINSKNVALTENPYVFHTLRLADTGDSNALALVQGAYPDYKVERTGREGVYSIYTLLAPEGTNIPAYSEGIASIIKGCETCPSGYTAADGGIVYTVTIEDDGTDNTALVQGLPGAVANSAVKLSQNDGVGLYSVMLDDELTQAEKDTFITANPTASFEKIGEAADVCINGTTSNTSWESGDTCHAKKETYKILVPDNECGTPRTADIQAAYPDLTITAGESKGCLTEFSADVLTNVVCDSCDPVVRAMFESEAPSPFEGISWVKEELPADNTALVGIEISGKPVENIPDEFMRHDVPLVDTSVRLSIAGGFPIQTGAALKIYDDRVNVKVMSIATEPDNKGYKFYADEDKSQAYFNGSAIHKDNYAKYSLGEDSAINPNAQYVDYIISVKRDNMVQYNKRLDELFHYHVLVEVGKHMDVENLLNSLATAAGLGGVKATATEVGA